MAEWADLQKQQTYNLKFDSFKMFPFLFLFEVKTIEIPLNYRNFSYKYITIEYNSWK